MIGLVIGACDAPKAPPPRADAQIDAPSPTPKIEASAEAIETRAWLEARAKRERDREPLPDLFDGFGFSDRLEASGIRFVHRIVPDAGKSYKAVHYDHGTGLAVADVDGDQRLDLFFVNQVGENQLWHNAGGGKFEDWTRRANLQLKDLVKVGATFADFDNDGDADLFVSTVRGGNAFFANAGDGRFNEITALAGLRHYAHSSGAVAFDYDRDGLLDLFLTNVGQYTTEQRGEGGYFIGHSDAFRGHLRPERSEKSVLYKNLGALRFKDVSSEVGLEHSGWSGDATIIDVNEDGFNDLYVLDMQGDDRLYVNEGGKKFREATAKYFPKTPWGAMGVKVFDFDGDARLDLYVTDMHSDMTEHLPPEAIDRERQKAKTILPDDVLRGGSDNIFGNALYRNLGKGKFEELSDRAGAENYWPWGPSAGDLNADGFEDLFVSTSMNYPFRYQPNSVLLNRAGRELVESAMKLGVEPRSGGRTHQVWFTLDCSAWDQSHERCQGKTGKVEVLGTLGTRSAVIFDLEGDGDLDLVTNEFNGPPQVLVSDLSEKKPVRWIAIRLEGKRSNKDGIGALVTVRLPNGRRLVKLHDGKSGYLSQSRMPLWFGLGDQERVEEITVKWPSGVKQTVSSTTAGRTIAIREG
jgi:enediyne biosynthesis protein E4